MPIRVSADDHSTTTAIGKTEGAKCAKLVRGEAIVQRVLDATLEELAQVGYRALRVEDVAVRAGVNKTTVYRRWPEKVALVRDAFNRHADDLLVSSETGALRSDLLALGRSIVSLMSSPQGQSLVRVLAAEGNDPDVAGIKKSLRDQSCVPHNVVANAIRRGELPSDVNVHLLLQAFFGTIHHKIFFVNEPVTEAYLESLADLLLAGVGCKTARPSPATDPGDRSATEVPAIPSVGQR